MKRHICPAVSVKRGRAKSRCSLSELTRDTAQKFPCGVPFPPLLLGQIIIGAQHRVLSCPVIPRRAVMPVIEGIEAQPVHMVQSAVHILHSGIFFGFTIFFIRLLNCMGVEFCDSFVFQQNADFHQEMVSSGYFGLPVEIIQLIPAEGRV